MAACMGDTAFPSGLSAFFQHCWPFGDKSSEFACVSHAFLDRNIVFPLQIRKLSAIISVNRQFLPFSFWTSTKYVWVYAIAPLKSSGFSSPFHFSVHSFPFFLLPLSLGGSRWLVFELKGSAHSHQLLKLCKVACFRHCVPCVPLFLFGSCLSGLSILYFAFNLCFTALFLVHLSSVMIHRVSLGWLFWSLYQGMCRC